jgi:SIR2-like domain
MSKSHSPNHAVVQLKEHLSSDKRKLSFLFGAGSSIAVGLPSVLTLTKQIEVIIDSKFKATFTKFKTDCGTDNIEIILNRLRTLRDLIGDSETVKYDGIAGKTYAQQLDFAICKSISELVSKSAASSIDPHLSFSNWLFKYQSNRINPVEIFTTNYDLLFEEAFEERKLPYFDGFIGTINPFLVPESIEAENTKQYNGVYIPFSWLRLWKIHGSINWYLYKDASSKNRITRNTGRICAPGDELMIFPSRLKYDESRRLPFLLYHDRLRKFLSNGEVLLLVNGYSFGDEHINEVIFQSLRANKRLAVTALIYGDIDKKRRFIQESVLKFGEELPNLTILGPDKACIGGNIAPWEFDGTPTIDDIFWIEKDKIFDLGNFTTFTDYLKQNYHFSI